MEIAPMMQTQDVAAIVPGMAAAGSAALPSRLPVAPLLFAALLKDMLPPEQAAAGPNGFPLNLTIVAKEPLSAKGNTVFTSPAGKPDGNPAAEEQSGDLSASALAQLLAMAAQTGSKPFVPATPQAPGETDQGSSNTFNTSGEEAGAPESPLPVMSVGSKPGLVAEGPVPASVNVLPQREEKAASVSTTVKNGQSQSSDGQVARFPAGAEKPSRGKMLPGTGLSQSDAGQAANQRIVSAPDSASSPDQAVQSVPAGTVQPSPATVPGKTVAAGLSQGKVATLYTNHGPATSSGATVSPAMAAVPENQAATGLQVESISLSDTKTPRAGTASPVIAAAPENNSTTGRSPAGPALHYENHSQSGTVLQGLFTVPENEQPSAPPAMSYGKDSLVVSASPEMTAVPDTNLASGLLQGAPASSHKKAAQAGALSVATAEVPDQPKTAGPQTENSTTLYKERAAVPGWDIKQVLQQTVQTEEARPVSAGEPAPDRIIETSDSKVIPGFPEQNTSQVDKARAAFGGVPAQSKPDTNVSSPLQNQAAVSPQGEPASVPTETVARQTQKMEDFAALSGLRPVGREMRQEQNLPDVDRAAGSPDNLLLEVVLVAQTPRGRTSGGEEKDGTGARKDEKERLSGPGMSAERMADQPVPGRFALTPKVEDQKNALHENILSQVKASVVSHDGKGNGTMTVRLNPVEFGELQINVRIENQQVKVEIITDNRTVRDALMGNLDALKETFQKQNLTMERFDVSSGGGNGSGQGFREERGEQQRINPIMSGHEAASFETAREQVEDDWGGTENSLVNLRL